MNKRIILVGKAGSGKDFMRKKLESRNFKYAVSYTTRPPRDGEVKGKDYFFISEEEARYMIDNYEFFEYVMFNGWLYGTTLKQWSQADGDDVFIMTPTGLSHVSEEDRKDCLVIYVDIHIDMRRARLVRRDMPGDSIERRIQADEDDFYKFTNFDIRITNPDF
jgi:guanylate kinase